MLGRIARSLIPSPVRREFRNRLLRRRLKDKPVRIVIGASGVFEAGWIPTDSDQLNLLEPETWARFLEVDSIDAILAEHVWEHLTFAEGMQAAATCFRYLKPGGRVRVAVPDGLFPDPEYQEYIKVGGAGGGLLHPGHLVVYTYASLREVFESAGFSTVLLEYHDEQGNFHGVDWSIAEGMIHRSRRFDDRGPISIVMDAIK